MEINKIYNEDCLVEMKKIDDRSIDALITDPPYMVLQDTTETWDKEWNMEAFVEEANRILKDNGYLFVFGLLSFLHKLMNFTDKYFRIHFNLIWVKPNSVNFHMANIKPMSRHEQIVCLIKYNAKPKSMTYNYRDIGEYKQPYRCTKKNRVNKAIASSIKDKGTIC